MLIATTMFSCLMGDSIKEKIIQKLPKYLLLLLIMFLVKIVLLWQCYGAISYKKFADNQKYYMGLEDNIKILKDKAKYLKNNNDFIEKLKEYSDSVNKLMPESKNISCFVNKISKLIYKTGLSLNKFHIKKERLESGYIAYPVQVELRGTYNKIALFFVKLEKIMRFTNVIDFCISRPKGYNCLDKLLKVKVNFEIYQFVNAVDVNIVTANSDILNKPDNIVNKNVDSKDFDVFDNFYMLQEAFSKLFINKKNYCSQLIKKFDRMRDPFLAAKSKTELDHIIKIKFEGKKNVLNSLNNINNRNNLSQYSLEQLQLIGIINIVNSDNRLQNNFGVIKAPNGEVFQVKIGDVIGVNNRKIVNITKKGIEYSN